MARVLVVEDDNLQSVSPGLSPTAKERAAQMTASGPAAIRAGVGLCPDVLTVDRPLGHSLNDILVTETVRAVRPATHPISLTESPSQDVREVGQL